MNSPAAAAVTTKLEKPRGSENSGPSGVPALSKPRPTMSKVKSNQTTRKLPVSSYATLGK
jgi:hypothetical protein